MRRFTLDDIAAEADCERHAVARWIKELISKEKFVKRSVGYGFTQQETKQLCKLLALDFDKISELKKIKLKK